VHTVHKQALWTFDTTAALELSAQMLLRGEDRIAAQRTPRAALRAVALNALIVFEFFGVHRCDIWLTRFLAAVQ